MIVSLGSISANQHADIGNQIPVYAVFKIWTSFISPMVLGRGGPSEPEENAKEPASSKRQEKLRKRQEKGDPRVRVSSVRK